MVAFIPDQDETVYNYAKPAPVIEPKPPRYKSKFASKVREAFHHGRYDHHTMGEAHYEPPAPNEFLRKNARQGIFNKRVKSARGHRDKDRTVCADENRRPPVPKSTDHIATPYRTRRNFVNKNALDAMLSEPSKIEDPQFVDEPKGNLQSKVNSGMMPNYVEKPKFGKVPGYLKRRKQEQVDEQKRWEEEQEAMAKRKEMMKLQDHERQSILDGLRANWSELHHLYQGLSLLTDTLPKKLRREKIEAQLDEIEKFIDLIEKNPVIVISDNPYLYS